MGGPHTALTAFRNVRACPAVRAARASPYGAPERLGAGRSPTPGWCFKPDPHPSPRRCICLTSWSVLKARPGVGSAGRLAAQRLAAMAPCSHEKGSKK